MSMSNLSRQTVHAGLAANNWICLFQKEDPRGSGAPFAARSLTVFQYNQLHVEVSAMGIWGDPRSCGANVLICIQDSADGLNWNNRFFDRTPIVPGGSRVFNITAWFRWVRMLAWSTQTGSIRAVVSTPEEQVQPGLWPDVSALACSAWCEVDCETGTETAG